MHILGESYGHAGVKKKKRRKKERKVEHSLQVRSFQDGGLRTREKGAHSERPSFVSGLNQGLKEICLDGSKRFSMGNM